MLGPKQYVQRASCNGTEVRLRINPGDQSWIVIKRAGCPADYHDVAEKDVDSVVERFTAINGDPGRFTAFVNAARPHSWSLPPG